MAPGHFNMNRWSDITRANNAQILAWAEARPWARAMAVCPQDAQWHAEGDVWTHTRMVCAELERGLQSASPCSAGRRWKHPAVLPVVRCSGVNAARRKTGPVS